MRASTSSRAAWVSDLSNEERGDHGEYRKVSKDIERHVNIGRRGDCRQGKGGILAEKNTHEKGIDKAAVGRWKAFR